MESFSIFKRPRFPSHPPHFHVSLHIRIRGFVGKWRNWHRCNMRKLGGTFLDTFLSSKRSDFIPEALFLVLFLHGNRDSRWFWSRRRHYWNSPFVSILLRSSQAHQSPLRLLLRSTLLLAPLPSTLIPTSSTRRETREAVKRPERSEIQGLPRGSSYNVHRHINRDRTRSGWKSVLPREKERMSLLSILAGTNRKKDGHRERSNARVFCHKLKKERHSYKYIWHSILFFSLGRTLNPALLIRLWCIGHKEIDQLESFIPIDSFSYALCIVHRTA